MSEWDRFLGRLKEAPEPPVLIPLVTDSPPRTNHKIDPVIKARQYVDFSGRRFSSELDKMLTQVKAAIRPC